MYDFLTIGTATRDIFMRVADGRILQGPPESPAGSMYLGFEYGSKIVTKDAFFSYGGGALNTSVSLAKMGLSVAAAFRIGREGTGDVMIAEMSRQGVGCDYVERDSVLHSGMSFIITVPGADHVIFHYPGAGANLALPDLNNIKTRWIYLTSLTGPAAGLMRTIEEKVETDGVKLVFNPGQTQIDPGYSAISDIIRKSYVLIVNRCEAVELVGSAEPAAPAAEIEGLISVMRDWGARYIVITDGQNGSYAYDGAGIIHQPIYPSHVIDTTGAGDAFGAALAAGMIHYDGNMARALRLASANSASVVEHDGALTGILNLADAEAFNGGDS